MVVRAHEKRDVIYFHAMPGAYRAHILCVRARIAYHCWVCVCVVSAAAAAVGTTSCACLCACTLPGLGAHAISRIDGRSCWSLPHRLPVLFAARSADRLTAASAAASAASNQQRSRSQGSDYGQVNNHFRVSAHTTYTTQKIARDLCKSEPGSTRANGFAKSPGKSCHKHGKRSLSR